jgi:hypothetical protein
VKGVGKSQSTDKGFGVRSSKEKWTAIQASRLREAEGEEGAHQWLVAAKVDLEWSDVLRDQLHHMTKAAYAIVKGEGRGRGRPPSTGAHHFWEIHSGGRFKVQCQFRERDSPRGNNVGDVHRPLQVSEIVGHGQEEWAVVRPVGGRWQVDKRRKVLNSWTRRIPTEGIVEGVMGNHRGCLDRLACEEDVLEHQLHCHCQSSSLGRSGEGRLAHDPAEEETWRPVGTVSLHDGGVEGAHLVPSGAGPEEVGMIFHRASRAVRACGAGGSA